MKARVEIIDETGRRFEGEVTLVATSKKASSAPVKGQRTAPIARPAPQELDFSVPLRPFLKVHSKGKSGAAKFALLVAHLSEGKMAVAIKKADIEQAWNKVTSHLGKFNSAYTTRAKDNGWVDSPKNGEYVLLPSWIDALSN